MTIYITLQCQTDDPSAVLGAYTTLDAAKASLRPHVLHGPAKDGTYTSQPVRHDWVEIIPVTLEGSIP